MTNQRENLLKIVSMTDEKTSSDGRKYRTVYFQPLPRPGVLSNAKARGRNIWEEGPMGSQGDALYPHLTNANGEKNIGAKVIGSVETVHTNEYFIENENGKFNHPESGAPANKAKTYTTVVFEDENIESLLPEGVKPAGVVEEDFEGAEIDEELAV